MSKQSKKVIYKMQLESERSKSKAEKFAYAVEGVSSINIDRTAHTLTASGTFDPIDVVKKLRKLSRVTMTIISIEPEEKSGKMKEEPDKEESKKAKLEEAGPSEEEPKKGDVGKLSDLYQVYNRDTPTYYSIDYPKKGDVGKLSDLYQVYNRDTPTYYPTDYPKKGDVGKLSDLYQVYNRDTPTYYPKKGDVEKPSDLYQVYNHDTSTCVIC